MSLLQSTVQNPLSVIGAKAVTIRRLIRRVRGGSQSWLIEGEDDRFYIAKFRGNPQGDRTLVNELYVYPLLSKLNVLTPPLSLLDLPDNLAQQDELYFVTGNRRTRPQGRLHLGSQVPVLNPETTAIFDFLPDRLLSKVANLADFATMIVLGIWCYRSDSLQAIFIRQRSGKKPFLVYSIDHGMFFDGIHWDLRDAPSRGLGFYKNVSSEIDIRTLTKEAVCKVQAITEQTLLANAQAIPSAWFAPGERELFGRLIVSLRNRQPTLPLMVTRHLDYLGF